ncbi:MAG: class I SAM-dependent methyltransferase [Syntrophobacteraceae bacterium]
MTDRKDIYKYWENPDTVSLIDTNLRQLETSFVMSNLSAGDELADFGCGDGESTVHYATKVTSCIALEYSNHLRQKAAKRFREAGLTNVTLVSGDVLDLSAFEAKFNVVVTQRVIINFMTWDEQKFVLHNIWKTLRPGGRYLMIENTFEGHEALNKVRRAVGLPNIPIHDWHNYFLHFDKFMSFIENKFVVERTHTFNLYYLLTRVFLNMFAKFDGYGKGAVKDNIYDTADAAARHLHELMADRVNITVDKGDAFGPIQGFVLRRMG